MGSHQCQKHFRAVGGHDDNLARGEPLKDVFGVHAADHHAERLAA